MKIQTIENAFTLNRDMKKYVYREIMTEAEKMNGIYNFLEFIYGNDLDKKTRAWRAIKNNSVDKIEELWKDYQAKRNEVKNENN